MYVLVEVVVDGTFCLPCVIALALYPALLTVSRKFGLYHHLSEMSDFVGVSSQRDYFA